MIDNRGNYYSALPDQSCLIVSLGFVAEAFPGCAAPGSMDAPHPSSSRHRISP